MQMSKSQKWVKQPGEEALWAPHGEAAVGQTLVQLSKACHSPK